MDEFYRYKCMWISIRYTDINVSCKNTKLTVINLGGERMDLVCRRKGLLSVKVFPELFWAILQKS